MAELPQILAGAVQAYEAALDKLQADAEAYTLAEMAKLSAHLKGRTITLYSGNGSVSLTISRRRPLAAGPSCERDDFYIYGYCIGPQASPWARWLATPDFLEALDAVDAETSQYISTAMGYLKFRDGKAIA